METPVFHEHVSCELLVTNVCNLRCAYCIARDLPGPPMSSEIGRKAIDLFFSLAQGAKSIEITFTGGEPLLQFLLVEELSRYCQDCAGESGMETHFVLKTNGTILDERIIDFVRLRRCRVVVSIDGIPATHDRFRRSACGERTHRVVSDNLLKLLKNRVPCVASVTIHPRACDTVLESVRYLHGLGVNQIDVGPAYGTVEWKERDCLGLAASLHDVAQYMRRVNATGARLEVGPLYRDSEHVGGVLSDRWGCHAGSANLAFLPTGQVTGCSSLAMLVRRFPELVLGDVTNGLDNRAIDRMLQLAQEAGENRPACRGCEASADCTGGCLAINYSTTGVPLVPPEFYCRTISAIPKAWDEAWAPLE